MGVRAVTVPEVEVSVSECEKGCGGGRPMWVLLQRCHRAGTRKLRVVGIIAWDPFEEDTAVSVQVL